MASRSKDILDVAAFRTAFEARLKELKRVKNVKNVRADLHPPASEDALNYLYQAFEDKLNPVILEFYMSVNGLYLGWVFREKRVPLFTGSVFIKSIERTLGSNAATGSENMFSLIKSGEHFRLVERGNLFEFETVDGLDMAVYVDAHARGKLPEMFVREEDVVYPLTVSFEEYLRLMIQTMGTNHWYLVLADPGYFDLSRAQYREFRNSIDTVFPDLEEPSLTRDLDEAG